MSPESEKLLREFAALSSNREQIVFLARNPVAFKIAFLARREEQTIQSKALDRILEISASLWKNPQTYPIGEGPIEKLAEQVAFGKISPHQAERVVGSQEIQEVMHPWYALGLCNHALDNLIENDSWRYALRLHRLTMVALEAAIPNSFKANLLAKATEIFLQIASRALAHAPDGRLYRQAKEYGIRALSELTDLGESALIGDLYHSMGILHLDTYTFGRTSLNYDLQVQAWKARLVGELGEEYYKIPSEKLKMPELTYALAEAERYFRLALARRTGHLKGLALKALAQTLEWRQTLGETVPEQQIAQLAEESLALLDRQRSPQIYSAAQAILERNGGIPGDDFPLDQPFENLIASVGLKQALWITVERVAAHSEKDPLRCLKLLHASIQQARRSELAEVLQTQLQLELNLIPKALGCPELFQVLPAAIEECLREARQRAIAERWDNRFLAATWFGIAAQSSAEDEEAEGLSLLQEISKLDPSFTVEYHEAMTYLRGVLWLGVGSNAFKADKLDSAVGAYGRALVYFLQLNLDRECMDLMLRIEDLINKGLNQVAEKAIQTLSITAAFLESRLGPSITFFLQRIFKRLMTYFQSNNVEGELLWRLWYAAKGQRMAISLRNTPVSYLWRQDERGMALLHEIAEAEKSMDERRDPPRYSKEFLLDEEMLLGAYARPAERQSGETKEEQWSNLQHTYEQHLTTILLANITKSPPFYLTLKQTQSMLDERTILVSYYFGASLDRSLALYFAVLTRQEVQIFGLGVDFPDTAFIAIGDEDLQIDIHPYSLIIAELRSLIQTEPPHGYTLLPEAEEVLAGHRGAFFGPGGLNLLQKLREEGKDHLCIVPHGPLHFYPFHLLGKPGDQFVDYWSVTYLPNLQLLERTRDKPALELCESSKSSVFGLSFIKNNPHGLPELSNVASEIHAIARELNVEPVQDDDASKSAFLRSLKESRWVHLATHGTYRAVAPSFQCLHLASEKGSDGRLAAYEVLDLDLRGLDLLTLSACETALGRFDQGDNLQGLPASFFLAGVSTIVGTLWPVSDTACRTFFQALYANLRQRCSKRDAFAAAQRQTRTEFPEHRDWGAFYLMGDWT